MAERNLVLFGILKTKKEVYKLNKERISIGRNRNSQIVINNNTISKDHAIIEFDEDGNAIIKDLNSSNGTYVNGQRLKVIPIRLKTGDKITFGKYDMEFIFEAFNTNGDSKTEADMNQYMFNGNNINNMNMNNNFNSASKDSNRVIFDKKINLVNENEISFARMNHFQNNNTQKNFQTRQCYAAGNKPTKSNFGYMNTASHFLTQKFSTFFKSLEHFTPAYVVIYMGR